MQILPRFSDDATEARYRGQYFDQNKVAIRVSYVLPAVLASLFFLIDRWIAPEAITLLLATRLSFIIGILLFFVLSFLPSFRKWWQLASHLAVVIYVVGLTVQGSATNELGSAVYSVQFMFSTMWIFLISRLPLLSAFVLSLMQVLIFIVGYLLIGPYQTELFYAYLFYMFIQIILGLIPRYILEQAERSIFHKNYMLTMAHKELTIAKQAAEGATRAKSTFLANMSHELRTPMNAIIGYSEMLIEEAPDLEPEEFVPDLAKIKGAGDHLLALINDILDLSKIEAGKTEVFVEAFEIDTLIDPAVATATPMIEKRGNRLQIKRAAEVGPARQDLIKLRQALLNLLSNAAKFTEQGTITLRVEAVFENQRDWLELTVEDSGIGIAEDKLEKVFEEFGQAETSTTRSYGGTGLGLPIARRFCRMLHGDLTVASTVGKGSAFTIRVPLELDDAGKPVPSSNTGGDEVADATLDPGSAATGRSVLVIDDDPEASELSCRLLVRAGLEAIHATSGAEGLKLARAHRPSMILLDIVMPEVDGWQVLEKLKSDPALAKTPVVVLSMLDETVDAYSKGAVDFLTKPVDRAALSRVIEKYCDAGTTSG